MDAPAEVTQKEGHTGFLFFFLSAMIALILMATRIQPSLSLATVNSNFVYPQINRSILVEHYLHFILFVRNSPGSCVCTEIRTHVSTSKGFEVTN